MSERCPCGRDDVFQSRLAGLGVKSKRCARCILEAVERATEDPDKYCVSAADGTCVSEDPRCMHNRPEPVA